MLEQFLCEMQDPVAQHQKLAKMARIAIRTLGRQRLKRSPAQNSELLAKSNAVILRYYGHTSLLQLTKSLVLKTITITQSSNSLASIHKHCSRTG